MFSETFEQAVVIPAQIYPCSFQLAASIRPQKTSSSCSSFLRKVKNKKHVLWPTSKQALTSRAAICWNREPHGHLLEQVVGGQTRSVAGRSGRAWPHWPAGISLWPVVACLPAALAGRGRPAAPLEEAATAQPSAPASFLESRRWHQ